MEIKFNINEYVKVKLTDYGRQILIEEAAELREEFPFLSSYKLPQEDERGYSCWQLWTLISTFGEYISLGNEQPFETEIIFITED